MVGGLARDSLGSGKQNDPSCYWLLISVSRRRERERESERGRERYRQCVLFMPAMVKVGREGMCVGVGRDS